jgi:signal peptidase I
VNVESKNTLRADRVPRSRKVIGLLLTGLAFVFWALWLRPEAFGGRADYIIVSGQSMLPTLHGGDLVAVRRQATYAVGDVVTYRIAAGEFRGRRIIHRIVGGNAPEGFHMRGDNKHDDDLWQPRPPDIEGKLWFRVPAAGRAVAFARAPAVLAAVAGGFAFAFAFTWPPRRWRESASASR